jgi:hypothetical protein
MLELREISKQESQPPSGSGRFLPGIRGGQGDGSGRNQYGRGLCGGGPGQEGNDEAPSRRLLNMVMVEQSAQRRFPFHIIRHCRGVRMVEPQKNQVAQALMRPTSVMVTPDRLEHIVQMPLTKQHHVVQRFPDLPYMSFCQGIALGDLWRDLDLPPPFW